MQSTRSLYGCTSIHPGKPCQGDHRPTSSREGVHFSINEEDEKDSYEGPPILHMALHKATWLAFYWFVLMLECGIVMNPSPLGMFVTRIVGPSLDQSRLITMIGDAMSISFLLGAVGGLIVTRFGPKRTSIAGHVIVIGSWVVIASIGTGLKMSSQFSSRAEIVMSLIHFATCSLGFGVQLVIMSHLWVGMLFVDSSAAALMILGSGVDFSATMIQWLCNMSDVTSPQIVTVTYVTCLIGVAWLDSGMQPPSIAQIAEELDNDDRVTTPASLAHRDQALDKTNPPKHASTKDTISARPQLVEIILQRRHDELSLRQTLLSPYTLGFALFFVVSLWRTKKLFAMNIHQIITSLGQSYSPTDADQGAAWANRTLNHFNLISGLAAIPAFFMGVITDRIGALMALMIVNTFSILMMLPISLIDILGNHKSTITVLLASSCGSYMVCSGFLFGMVTAFNIKVFGFKQISALQGLYISLAGIVSFLNDSYFKQVYIDTGGSSFDSMKNKKWMILMNVSLYAVPMCLFLYGDYKTRAFRTEQSQLNDKEDLTSSNDTVDDASTPFWLPLLSAVFVHEPDNCGFKQNTMQYMLGDPTHGSQIVSSSKLKHGQQTEDAPPSPIRRLLHYNSSMEPGKCSAQKWVESMLHTIQECSYSHQSPLTTRSSRSHNFFVDHSGDSITNSSIEGCITDPDSEEHKTAQDCESGLKTPLLASKSEEACLAQAPVERWIDAMVVSVQEYEFSSNSRMPN